MKKLGEKASFLREFWTCFESDRRDMQLVKEELVAERVALSVLKSGEVKGAQVEKVLLGNELSSMMSTLKPIALE
jgi:hypothetical protein